MQVRPELQFNTLVFLTNQPSVNTRRKGEAMQRSYVRQALSLAKSLNGLGQRLRVFTNDEESLREITLAEAPSADLPYTIHQLRFPEDIPKTMQFFAAHHKLFLFSVFAHEDHLNCLLDTDVVANCGRQSLLTLLEENPRVDGWVYDISDQVFPAYGTTAVQNDLRCKVGVQHPFPRWYGGEFIIGNARLFGYLNEECNRHLQRYIAVSFELRHTSDEFLVSAALNNNHENLVLADAGASGLVVRHWASRTLHVKKPASVLEQSLFWHLPNSKDAQALYRKHGSLRMLYRHVQGLTLAKNTVGYLRQAMRWN